MGLCVNFFFVKDFSGTTEPRILKFGTNVGYNLLYCVRENQPPPPYHSHYLSIFLSLQKKFCHRFLGFFESQSLQICIHLERGQVYCGKENQDAEINFCLLFPFLLVSISHSNVIHREICVKDFSGTTAPRILKFGTNVGYDLLHCVRENQPPGGYHFLHLSIFLYLHLNFLLQISLLLWEPESSNYLYTLRVVKFIVGQKTKMLRFIFTIFFHFSISHFNVIYREICVEDFSGTTCTARILKFGTNDGYNLLYCEKENQHAAAYHSLYLSIFLPLQ